MIYNTTLTHYVIVLFYCFYQLQIETELLQDFVTVRGSTLFIISSCVAISSYKLTEPDFVIVSYTILTYTISVKESGQAGHNCEC